MDTENNRELSYLSLVLIAAKYISRIYIDKNPPPPTQNTSSTEETAPSTTANSATVSAVCIKKMKSVIPWIVSTIQAKHLTNACTITLSKFVNY